jgi:hypothetical protein
METSSLNSISLSLYNLWNLCNLSKNAICSRCLRFVSFMVVWKGNPEYLHRLHYVFTLANLQQGFFMELFKAFHQSIALSYLYKKNHGSLSLSLRFPMPFWFITWAGLRLWSQTLQVAARRSMYRYLKTWQELCCIYSLCRIYQ